MHGGHIHPKAKAMKHHHPSPSEEDENGTSKLAFCWWKTAQEFDENGHLKLDLTNLSSLTPRLKVLREMERLAFIAQEGLDDLRHKLITYRSGDFWLPTGGIKKEDINIPPIITILLLGISGSGKSSLVNLMYSVLSRSGLIPFAQTSCESSKYTTMYLEEHNVVRSMRNGFCVYDTRGLDTTRMSECLDEISTWMADGVRHYQYCSRSGDWSMVTALSTGRFSARPVNCAMVVANLAEIHRALESGDKKPLEATRDLFHCRSIRKSTADENPILILTHGDLLSAKDRIDSRLKICEYLGVPETSGAYDIACLTEQGILPEESDPVTAFALTEAIYRALMQSDRTHLPKKKPKDWIFLFLSWIMCSIASFFALLAYFFSKLGHKNKLKA